ncbi:Zn-ribbon domain-containing OB-fold protein [Antrihabitans sp. YC2-6]|uniref:Zn-ribbon domain-containing OB-fold protein n=1 Tax=Antrihabitans sp. YC2-6 TaxID=2799498 RepID=UPI001F240422|nr:OB-fold domain-containing protein [Antrihabitans sp. YC2-6]
MASTTATGAPTLLIRRCGTCNKLLAPLTVACSFCQGFDLEWVPSSGTGSIVSWKVTHRYPHGPHGELLPSTKAIVQLDDGPWVYSTIEGEVPPHSDRPVRVQFQPSPVGGAFPVFGIRPSDAVAAPETWPLAG